MNIETRPELPYSVTPIFPPGALEPEMEELKNDIILYNKLGIPYDHELCKRIIRLIFKRKGKEYKQLVRYTANLIMRSPLRYQIGGVHEVINILIASIFSGKTIWRYSFVPFYLFGTKAIDNIIRVLRKEKGVIRKYTLPPECEDDLVCNIVELAPHPEQSVMDRYDETETMEKYLACLSKKDPVAFNVLKLVLDGLTSEQIASELNISFKEVLNARRRYKKIAKRFYPSGNDLYEKRRKPKQPKYVKEVQPKQLAVYENSFDEFIY